MNFHTHGNSPDVGGDDRVVGEQSAAIHSPDATRKILDRLSLPWRAVPVAPRLNVNRRDDGCRVRCRFLHRRCALIEGTTTAKTNSMSSPRLEIAAVGPRDVSEQSFEAVEDEVGGISISLRTFDCSPFSRQVVFLPLWLDLIVDVAQRARRPVRHAVGFFNRQVSRTVHFCVLLYFMAFLATHITRLMIFCAFVFDGRSCCLTFCPRSRRHTSLRAWR